MKHFLTIVFLVSFLNVGCFYSAEAQNGIGLVLSGGGAKGFAHIGVLKILDSLQVSVDYVGGTSIGAIIGSLYALGYTGNDIEQMALHTDWEQLFSDEANRSLIPFFQKNLMERYIATFKINNDGIELPKGFISGQNIINFFSEITLSAHTINDFHQFKIPFFCIATDIGTGKDVVLEDGFLATALRATMSIPTAFSPFERNDRLLIDGGVINNFPVDVMKERYAGPILGVDIQKGMIPTKDIESFASVIDQLVTISDLPRFATNKPLCNYYIHPNIEGFSVSSFSTEAVDSLIKRGEAAARKLIPELKKYSCDETYNKHHTNDKQTAIIKDTVFTVNEIFVKGQKRNSSQYIRRKMGIEIGKQFTLAQLKQGINSLYATNEYEYISYRFVEDSVLQIFCKERNVTSIGVGINYQTGNNASVLLNYTQKNILLNGDLLSIDGKLSNLPGFKALYVLDKGAIPAPLVLVQDNTIGFNFYTNNTHTGNALVNLGVVEAGFNAKAENLMSMGIAANAQIFHIYGVINPAGSNVAISKAESEIYYNYKFYTTYDSQNSSVLPTRGDKFYADIEAHTDNFITYKDASPMVSIMFHNERALRLSDRLTLLLNEGARFFLTDSLPHPMLKTYLGGDYQPDLYTYNFPFQGLSFAEVISKNVMLFGAGIRYQVYKRHYVSLLPNVAAACDYFIFKDKTNYIMGAGINYTYNSIFGPLQYTLSYSNQSKSLIEFISLGYKF